MKSVCVNATRATQTEQKKPNANERMRMASIKRANQIFERNTEKSHRNCVTEMCVCLCPNLWVRIFHLAHINDGPPRREKISELSTLIFQSASGRCEWFSSIANVSGCHNAVKCYRLFVECLCISAVGFCFALILRYFPNESKAKKNTHTHNISNNREHAVNRHD